MASLQKRVVIIGAGMAGSKLAYELSTLEHTPFRVTLIGEEAQIGYNRIMLSSVLAKEVSSEEIALVDVGAMSQYGAEILSSDPVEEADYECKKVRLRSGREIAFDYLVYATGARSFLPNWAQVDAKNVVGFRDWKDVNALLSLASGSNVAVVGGGLLGLEAAVGLAKNGHTPTVIQRSDYILNRQLDARSAHLLQDNLQGKGVKFLTGANPECLEVDHASSLVTAIKTDKGLINVDMVVVATGISPEIQVAKQSGLEVDRAILVGADMQTSEPGVYALGECCQFETHTFGLVAPIWDQLNVLVKTLQGQSAEFSVRPISTKLKVSGVDLFSVGEIQSVPDQEIVLFDSGLNHYRKLIVKGDCLVGAILYGNVADGSWYSQLIQNETNISEMLEFLAFGEAYCQS
ncbi:NAD(P)/FAD-dependent oxidoreductase [Marinomonas communis]|uniref:Assimilatory nitrate reductase (NADH) beta subunit n=1 Tax=Marinomonas communis TaxID=28254 RepID=A0A4R6X2Y6_9GAMM|nr:FAD-dependent oxidoreductase [Marinomonas communis]TDR06818.1 assimilatory nitrate reductase (NADH) beta subunit [Marinomonas communis]